MLDQFYRAKASTILGAAVIAVTFMAASPSTANARQILVYPGMTIQAGNRICTVGATGEIGGQKYAVTAAHCAEPNAYVSDDRGDKIGFFAETFGDDTNTDNLGFALIRLTGKLTVRAGIDSAESAYRVGESVCHTGYASGTVCGAITKSATNYLVADFPSARGDSGGVVFRPTAGDGDFLGILIGTKTDGQVIVESARYIRETIDANFNTGYHFSWHVG
ncbi:hypothetical protein [Nocardia jejuensis]|uniref:hypothetical protein n=1 Tax=Nocardia jejuensis TaxID=328049 RepID=UPI0012FC9771|nr:hypothetical protein [Nocardia jejuensis]